MDETLSNITRRQQANIYSLLSHSSDKWQDIPSLPIPSVEPALSAEKELLNLFRYYFDSYVYQILSTEPFSLTVKLENNLTGPARFYDFPQQDLFISSAPTVDTTKLDQIGSLYSLRNHEEVLNFLNNNVPLIDILLDAFPELQLYFGADVKVDLVLRTDPEELYQELFGYIKASRSIDETHASLEEFDDHWFLDHLDATRGLLNFNLVFS